MPLAHPACRLGNIVGCKPLRWIGVRSYGIYLWQTPVIVLTSPTAPARPRPGPRRAPGGGDLRDRGALLEIRRGADPPRRDRSAAGAAPAGRLELGDVLARGADRPGHDRRALHRRDRGHGRPQRGAGRRRTDPGQGSYGGRHQRPGPADQGPGRRLADDLLQGGRPHRRLDLGGARLGRIPAQPERADRKPLRRSRGERNPHGGAGRALDRRALRRRTERPGSRPRRGRPKATKGVGSWPWGRTRRPTWRRARTSGSKNGSRK